MSTPSSSSFRLVWVVLLASLGALGLGGCKQDLGERCEQASDCSSGYCGGSSSAVGMTMATAQTCTPGPSTAVVDSGTTPESPTDAADGAVDAGVDAVDGATDVSEAGDAADASREAGASDASTEAGTDGVDASADAVGDTGDAAGSDAAALEAGTAG